MAVDVGTLDHLYRSCVVEVKDRGTGFLIDKRTALTCAHLFIDIERWPLPPKEATVVWNGVEGRARVTCVRSAECRSCADIAFLDEITWDKEIPDIPFVLLSNDWEPGDHYYVWGYPEDDFTGGSALTFSYNDTDGIHRLGPTYKKLNGPFYPAPGFSGSPILNKKRGVVCGLAAISLDRVAAEGIAAVPISYVFEQRPHLEPQLRELHKQSSSWWDLTPAGRVWQLARDKCRGMISAIPEFYRRADDKRYQPRQIESSLQEFLRSNRTGMFIVGNSGMGKTTLLARLALEQASTKNLLAIVESSLLSPELETIEAELASRLGWKSDLWNLDQFWLFLNDGAAWQGGSIVICIDAVNEYNQGHENPRPVQLLIVLDRLICKFKSAYPQIKFIVTCRPETWRNAIDNVQSLFRTDPDAYFRPGEEVAWLLSWFSEEEFKGAYERYKITCGFKTLFKDLTEVAKSRLRDPFLLSIAELAYRNQEIPRDIDTGALFEAYLHHPDLTKYEDNLKSIVRALFMGEGPRDAVKRTAFPRDLLLDYNRRLYDDLDFNNELSPGFSLLEKNLLRRWESTDEFGAQLQIRFTHDRLAEYLLSLRFIDMIRERVAAGMDDAAATTAVVAANLTPSQRMAVVYGALQRTLNATKGKPNYASILRAVAAIDARGQWLVISVLATTARNVDNGIEMLQDLLSRLAKHERRDQNTFPFMESVYRVLQDDDYRLWLGEQGTKIQDRHLSVLYKYFVKAFQSSDDTDSTAALLYLFFMWQSQQDRRFHDAKEITGRLTQEIRPLILMSMSSAGRALFRNLTAEFFLVLPEAAEDRYREALEFAHVAFCRLKVNVLGKTAAVLVNSMLVNFLLQVLGQLPNPVQLPSLDAYFASRDKLLPFAERILNLLGSHQAPSMCSPEDFRHLVQCENGILVQLLTFTLSAAYERPQSDEDRHKILALTKECFFQEPRYDLAEYCSSLSVYHINCFGRYANGESMQLMGKMATEILSQRKGRVRFLGKSHNFNIIGTYGRALHLHPSSTSELGTNRWGMEFAFQALDQAIATQDSEYYLYICENLGLLGTLVEPRYLFDVFTRILEGVGARGEQSKRKLIPLPHETIAQARTRILQSLANIRVLYRQQVDKYLLELLESPELYAEVVNDRKPDFRLSVFFSWSFEQLMFRCLVYHYDNIGKEILDSFWDGLHCNSTPDAARALLSRLLNYVTGHWT
ncbi:MAG: trypsin-like peptidase domain-containing protein [Terracidiphilus sp.]|jgi:hypothetical protein